jgi:tRNA dimethylallyltransferase
MCEFEAYYPLISMPQLITLLGPTATGKTTIAAHLAKELDGEVISADSRQVYRGLTIGTGKDLDAYSIGKQTIAYHLIDIHDIGFEYNVFEFQEDFHNAFKDVTNRKKQPILCGGTGLYLQAVLDGYKLYPVPANPDLRAELEGKDMKELVEILKDLTSLHNVSDTTIKKRTVRAIEIARYCKENKIVQETYPPLTNITFGVSFERRLLKQRITSRLNERLENGLVEEVKGLLKSGISVDQLKFYGLEYKFLALHLNDGLNYNDMYQKLNSAIHQFAKRQMTWFRRMEKQGHQIYWIDGNLDLDDKIDLMKKRIQEYKS